MARTKETARRIPKEIVTWTRFYLPKGQEWPTWSGNHANVRLGPLSEVRGLRGNSLGRMVDRPEQAAYIIKWNSLEAIKAFQSSPACAEFLRNLPQYDNDDSQVSVDRLVDSSPGLRDLTLDHTSSSSSSSSSRRFLVLDHTYDGPTRSIKDRMIFNTLLIPYKFEDWIMFKERFRGFRQHNMFGPTFDVWFSVMIEDDWVEEKFGKMEQSQTQSQEANQARTILCNLYIWDQTEPGPEYYEVVFAEDEETWNENLAQVMPPVTAWVQERWDVCEVPWG